MPEGNCPFLDACTKAIHGPGLECKDGCVFHRFGVLVNNQAVDKVLHLNFNALRTVEEISAFKMEVPK